MQTELFQFEDLSMAALGTEFICDLDSEDKTCPNGGGLTSCQGRSQVGAAANERDNASWLLHRAAAILQGG